MKQLVSAYGASRLLERDRQTIERAVRGLAPDGYEGKSPRWQLARIVEALNARHASKSNKSEIDTALQRQLDRLDELDARLRSAPTVQQRRELARELFPILAGVDRLMREDAKRSGEPAELTGYRCAAHAQHGARDPARVLQLDLR